MQKDARLSASPSIGSGDEPAPRPVVSVVIPTFEPDRLLLETIGSAILMGGGPAVMYGCEAWEALKQFKKERASANGH